MGETQCKKKINLFFKNLLISLVMLIVFIGAVIVYFKFGFDRQTDTHEWFNIDMISELSALECKYHNVTVHKEEGNVLTIGKKYVWFEYDVIVNVGIDTKKVKVEKPTSSGIVKIHLPSAKVLGIKADSKSIQKPVSELGFMTKLTTDEEVSIISNATKKLENDSQMKELINEANKSTKNVLEKYIEKIGELTGENYTIEWVEATETSQTATPETNNQNK